MGELQFAYNDQLSALCGTPPLGEWRAAMYRATGVRKRAATATYRQEQPTIASARHCVHHMNTFFLGLNNGAVRVETRSVRVESA